MITPERLRSLLAGGESDRVEFTTSTARTEKFGEAICAFANDFPRHRAPGYLLIGVDEGGRPSGLRVGDRFLRRVASLRSSVHLEPSPPMAVGKVSLERGDVVVVEVLPSDLPPVRFKGRVWIRVGPMRSAASRHEEKILTERRVGWAPFFDLRPVPGCTLDDLTPGLFTSGYLPAAVSLDVLEENDRELKEQMASLRFYDLKANRPTNAAVLLFAKDPLHWIPGAWLQFVQWSGTTIADDPVMYRDFRGDLLFLLRELDTFTALPTLSRPVRASPLRERNEIDYPRPALRELLMNAIMHRSYEPNAPVRYHWFADRIEILSPGGLYGMVSPENFPRQTDYRNPVVAEAMATLGYVNRFGRGVLRAEAALRNNGNPKLEFHFDPSHVLVTVRPRS